MDEHQHNGHIPHGGGGSEVEYPALVYHVAEVRLSKSGDYTATLHRKHYKAHGGFDPMWTTTDVMVVEVNEGQARIAEACLKEERDIPVTVHWPFWNAEGELEDSVEWVAEEDEEEEGDEAEGETEPPNGLPEEASGEE